MSRIGFQPVQVPNGVTVTFNDGTIQVKGAKGELFQRYLPVVDFKMEDGTIHVSRKNESNQVKALHGLYRSLLSNMLTGVSQGYSKILMVNGVGYRAELLGKKLLLSLGFSNPVEYMIPEGIQIEVEKNTRITVSGISKETVGQVAAEIRKIRPPEPYKGKGIRYEDEVVRRKVGKAGAK